nr:MAG TPA: hypothetical protein [Caudoviricetes sp.]
MLPHDGKLFYNDLLVNGDKFKKDGLYFFL